MLQAPSILVLALLASAPAAGASPCPRAQLSRLSAEIAADRGTLQSIPIAEFEETEVPRAAQEPLRRLKEDLGALVAAQMDCVAVTSVPDPAVVAAALDALTGGGADANLRGVEGESGYGASVSFEASVTPDDRRLFTVVTNIGIECGSDALLSVFAPQSGRWREVLRWQSRPYDQVSGAFGNFRFALSPSNGDGQWYLVAAHIKPWCSSTWSSLDYEVLRPGDRATNPRLLLRESRSMWFGGDDYGTLSTGAGEFDVRYHGASADSGVHNRLFIHHYAISGDAVRRIEPVAASARDFVDEWSNSDWAEALGWTDPGARDQARSVHERLRGGSGFAYFSFESIRSCAPDPDRVQVEILNDATDERLFFQVRGSASSFRLADVGPKPDARCTKDVVEPGS